MLSLCLHGLHKVNNRQYQNSCERCDDNCGQSKGASWVINVANLHQQMRCSIWMLDGHT